MKKILALVLAAALVLGLAACGGKAPGPEGTVDTFCGAMKAFDLEKMRECVISDEDIMAEIEGEEDEMTALFMDRMKEWAGKMTYQAEEPELDGDSATVKVKFTYTDASPVFGEVLKEYFMQALAMAFSGASEEEMGQLFEKILTEQLEKTAVSTAEETVNFACTKAEDGWKINEVPDEAVNVLTSNIKKAFEGLEELEESGSLDEPEVTEWTQVPAGTEVTLDTVKLSVISCEETTHIGSEYFDTDAQEGTKFVIYTLNVENITASPITFDCSGFALTDSSGRTFKLYDDAFWYLDDNLCYTELSPNIPATGKIVYNVPADAADYFFSCAKAGTTEGFRFLGK